MLLQLMLKVNRGLYTGGNFRAKIWEKNEVKLGTLFIIMI